jgi:crotonobetainyl-CoA:carnitine CoA-transferase CaiB-like acyl-CoA transferase
MMTSQAGDDDPVANTIAIIDVSTAAMCVLASLLGIYNREKTGEGQRIWNSLAATATYLQSEELVRYQGRPALVKGSENHRGPSWLDRFYKTKDGWIRIQAIAPDQVSKESLAKAGIKLNGANDKVQAMAEVLEPLESEDAIKRLAGAGVSAIQARRVSQVMRDPELLKEEFVHIRPAADGTYFSAPGRFATFSRTQRSGPMRVSGIGEHAVEVLTSAGLKPEKIQALGEQGAITIGKPMPQQLMPSYR